MSLNLHPDCKARLKDELAGQLDTIEVKNKAFLDRQSTSGFLWASNALPKHGPIATELESFFGEWPFYDFLYGYISKELHEQQEFDSSVPVCKLTDIEGYSDASQTADRLVETFDSLPWDYVFTLKFDQFLSPVFKEQQNRYRLSSTVSLIQPDDQIIEEYPLKSGIEGRDKWLFGRGLLTAFGGAKEWDKDSVYLQFNTSGFVGKNISTKTSEDVSSLLKSFLGLSIAVRLIKVEYSYRPESPRMHFYVHRRIDGSQVIDDTNEVSEDLSRTISDLAFHDLDGTYDTDDNKKAWMVTSLSKLKKVFSNIDQSERLLLAGQWFFDCSSSRNELLSFLQAMVTLEILLGDKATSDAIGLNELLRNRCAYLIGKNHKQRGEILSNFKEIYDIRSKIIHRGKSKLNYRERSFFTNLQWLCRRVIQEEIDLISEE